MAISVKRAAECIGRPVTYPNAKSKGVIHRVDIEFNKVFVMFTGEEEPELVNPEYLFWLDLLDDQEADYFDNHAGLDEAITFNTGGIERADGKDTRFYMRSDDGRWAYLQLTPPWTDIGGYLDIVALCPDTQRALRIDDRERSDFIWEIEERLGWKER